MLSFSGERSPRIDLTSESQKPVLWRLHQADNSSRNFASLDPVTYGYPTRIVFGSTPTFMPGSFITISGVVGATGLNGTHRVLWVSGNSVAIDYDSGESPLWTSGGTATPAVIQDEFSVFSAMPIQGTVTGIWSNPTLGLTAHSGGTYSLRQTSNLNEFDLSTYAGIVVLGFEFQKTANPTAQEYLFSLGRNTASGANSSFGNVSARIQTDGQIMFNIRPRASADGGASNTTLFSGAISNDIATRCALVLDMSEPNNWYVHFIRDGVLTRSNSVNMTGSVGGPSTGAGFAIGSDINASLVQTNFLGAGGSTAKVQNLYWWKTSKTMTDVFRAITRFHRNGSLAGML